MKFVIYDTDISQLFMEKTLFGGAALRKYLFAKGFVFNDVDVAIILFKGEKQFLKNKNIEVYESYFPEKGIRYLRWIYYRLPLIIKSLYKSKGTHFIITSGGGFINLIVGFYSFLSRSRLVMLIKNDEDVEPIIQIKKIDYVIQSFLFRLSDKIICQNNYQLNKIENTHFKKITVIKNPFVVRNLDIISNRKYVAFLGSFRPVKNINALFEIAKNCPDIQFRIAGDFPSPKDKSNDMETKYRLAKLQNVKFVGFIPHNEVASYLAEAYCLLNTSFFEGFSNTFLEAFSVGTPVVTLGVNPDFILTKYNLGFVNKIEEMGQTFDMFNNNFDYIEFKKRSIKYLIDNHSYDKISKELIEFVK